MNPRQRATERHEFWPGFIVGIMGLLVLVCGAGHATRIETTEGGTAWEWELVRAFTSGGLQAVDMQEPPDPSVYTDPGRMAQAMEQWERTRTGSGSAGLKYRVNPNAQTPCPT